MSNVVKCIEAENRIVAAEGYGEREMASSMSIEF